PVVYATTCMTANGAIPPTRTVASSRATINDVTAGVSTPCCVTPRQAGQQSLDCTGAQVTSGDRMVLSLTMTTNIPTLTSGTISIVANDPGIVFTQASSTASGSCTNANPTNTCTTAITPGTVVAFFFDDDSTIQNPSLTVTIASP